MSIQNTAINGGAAISPILFGSIVHATSWPFAFAAMALAPLIAWFVLASLVDDEDAGRTPATTVSPTSPLP